MTEKNNPRRLSFEIFRYNPEDPEYESGDSAADEVVVEDVPQDRCSVDEVVPVPER